MNLVAVSRAGSPLLLLIVTIHACTLQDFGYLQKGRGSAASDGGGGRLGSAAGQSGGEAGRAAGNGSGGKAAAGTDDDGWDGSNATTGAGGGDQGVGGTRPIDASAGAIHAEAGVGGIATNVDAGWDSSTGSGRGGRGSGGAPEGSDGGPAGSGGVLLGAGGTTESGGTTLGAGGTTTAESGGSTGAGGVCDLCAARAALVHRYKFDGTGTQITDSVGTAHGIVLNSSLSGTGNLVLAGGSSGQYVDLPNHLLSSLSEATLEVWVNWYGGNAYQRILDFGDTTSGIEGTPGEGRSFVLIAPSAEAGLRGSYRSTSQSSSIDTTASSTLPQGVISHVALVLNEQNQSLHLYLNGSLASSASGIQSLSNVNDVNVWLGRSQYSTDPGFGGIYYEFRVYGAALTAAQVGASFAAGYDD